MAEANDPRSTGKGAHSALRRRVLAWVASSLVALGAITLPSLGAAPPKEALHVATFDSGFGGYLTAKSIEGTAASLLRDYDTAITVHHYGDTQNLPYGEKTPAQIATLGSAGVLRAFEEGADMVFIACNTASTQYQHIRQAVDAAYPGQDKPVVSVIEVSTQEAKRRLDQVLARRPTAVFTILATPATLKSMVYPRQLATLYGATLDAEAPRTFPQPRWYTPNGATITSLTQKSVLALPEGRRIDVWQLAPANWVELIEHGADARLKRDAVHRDLGLLLPQLAKDAAPDVVGYFCTHYPIFDSMIRQEIATRRPAARAPEYISQGQLMADLFKGMAEARLEGRQRRVPISPEALQTLVAGARADITISGRNGATTRELVRTMFPRDPAPLVTEENLGSLEPAGERVVK
jgi:glutamate racemase